MVELQNRRHKGAEREWECYVCKGKFMSAQKRNSCDVCIEKLIKEGVKKPALAVTMRKWRAGNKTFFIKLRIDQFNSGNLLWG